MSLPTLLHLLEIESLTGWLLVDSELRIDFYRGRVTGASAGAKEGVDALKEVLVARGTRFEVLRGRPDHEEALERVSAIVFDSYRLLDEWATIEGMTLRLVGDQRWRPSGREIDALMDAIDGKTTVRDLVAQSGLSLCIVVDELLEAKQLGLVVDAAPAPGAVDSAKAGEIEDREPPPAPTTDDLFVGIDFFELLDRARASTRGGDYGSAQGALEAALRLRPGDKIASQNLRRVRELRGA